MIYYHWNHSQVPPKKPSQPSYTHYNKTRYEFLTSSPNKRSFEIKTQRNRINCTRLISLKVHLSKTIHDWHRPLRIVPYRAIIYASFSKRAPMTVTWSNKQVNNTLIASRQAYIYTLIYKGDQGIVHKIGPRNRHSMKGFPTDSRHSNGNKLCPSPTWPLSVLKRIRIYAVSALDRKKTASRFSCT